MTRWFRFYDDALHDPKVQRLHPSLFKTWVNILCVASRNGGKLPDIHDLSYLLHKPDDIVRQEVNKLIDKGLIDEYEDGMEPHNWCSRQYQSDVSTERVKRFRKRSRNVSLAVSETPPEQSTENRTEQKDSEAKASGADAPIDDPSVAEKQLFDRGKEVFGPKAGGMIVRILKAKGGNVALARAAIEQASTKQDPLEYAAAIARGPPVGVGPRPGSREDTRERTVNAIRTALIDDFDGCQDDSSPLARFLPFHKPA